MNGLPNGSAFPPTSRYYGNATAAFVDRKGTAHVYVLRRFIPPQQAFATIKRHTVVQGERYDTLAATYIGDPEQFWRLADANGVTDPSDLEAPGLRVRVTLPAGIPGHPGD
jgi:hypothetical protein